MWVLALTDCTRHCEKESEVISLTAQAVKSALKCGGVIFGIEDIDGRVAQRTLAENCSHDFSSFINFL